jgi:hypothetical protein
MAQATDYSLANQSGANFRSELNTVLAAVVSQNSGSTEPTTAYAYQWWIDTGVTPALLKLRNAANNAWITIGDVTAANLGLVSPAGATFTGNVTLNGQSDLRLADSDSSNWLALQAPATVASNVTWTLPATDGTAGQTLATDAADVLSWVTRAALGSAQSFTAAQRGSITALTDGATITPDFALANNFSVTLGGNRTLANPSNQTAGQSGAIVITQDGTGSRTLAYGSNWKFPGGTAPTLTTAANAVDVVAYYVESATRITARLISDVK